eukprot:5933663-Pyramimonas_sp.AAC.2
MSLDNKTLTWFTPLLKTSLLKGQPHSRLVCCCWLAIKERTAGRDSPDKSVVLGLCDVCRRRQSSRGSLR